MTPTLTAEQIAPALRQSGAGAAFAGQALSLLTTKGISHDHWRISDSGWVLRVPRMSQWGLDAQSQLTYEATAFERAGASAHTPRLHTTLPPCEELPRGALIVSLIDGRPPRLPEDLPAIAAAFAAIHQLPLPQNQRLPLQNHDAPIAATLRVIEDQADYLVDAELSDEARAMVADELTWARRFATTGEPAFALCLVGTDTHPGNFLIDGAGKAWFVDLEKALYGAAPIDLAHASLAVSTGWDPECAARLANHEVAAFYRTYLARIDAARAAELKPWLLPLRRLTWLRTMTWFARWQAAWRGGDHPASRDAAMSAHIERHIAASFDVEAIASARADWLEADLANAIA